jgi:phage terminase small subunit
MALTPKQARFVEEYLIDLNATQAATRAGYSAKTAKQQGSLLLTYTDVQEAVMARQKKRVAKTQVTQAFVLDRLALIATECSNKNGKLWDPTAARGALQLLGKHLGMFSDKVMLGGKVDGEVEAKADGTFRFTMVPGDDQV